ncbi:Transposase associated domain-containing protein [Forsythia ovata]|uniref:Transposase associated domain-containing protein n=1 Tax=Forsythia ovata TaxID=205694 RepID=A0ABD1WJ31_9LAMI
MDKSWVRMHPCTKEFDDGLKAFIEHAFAHGFVCASKVKCPCIDYKNMNDVNKEILYEHLICRGMMSNYKVWHLHGEKFETTPTPETIIDNIDGECGECSDGGDRDYIIDMLRDRRHNHLLKMLNPKLPIREIQKKHKNEFAGWFKECIITANKAKQSIHVELGVIAEGPFAIEKRFTGYTVGGFHFKTVGRDRGSTTQ